MEKSTPAKEPIIFFDFDNTITTFDLLDDMLVKFSRDNSWMSLEEDWKNGRIGSRECLKGQVEGLSLTKEALDKYLRSVKLDPYFKKIAGFLKERKVKTLILSDNFDYILNKVLSDNGITGIEVYSNSLSIDGDRLIPTFPLTNNSCGDCAHCKKTSLFKNTDDRTTSVYIGDGRSDVCVSQEADIVFAKGYLKDYCARKRISHIPFNQLKDVYEYFLKLPVQASGEAVRAR